MSKRCDRNSDKNTKRAMRTFLAAHDIAENEDTRATKEHRGHEPNQKATGSEVQ